MDWQIVGSIAAVGACCFAMNALSEIKALSRRLDRIEAAQQWFREKRDEQLEGIGSVVSEVSTAVKDLADFQKGDGRYRYDPDDPRLPAHIRDRTGKED